MFLKGHVTDNILAESQMRGTLVCGMMSMHNLLQAPLFSTEKFDVLLRDMATKYNEPLQFHDLEHGGYSVSAMQLAFQSLGLEMQQVNPDIFKTITTGAEVVALFEGAPGLMRATVGHWTCYLYRDGFILLFDSYGPNKNPPESVCTKIPAESFNVQHLKSSEGVWRLSLIHI